MTTNQSGRRASTAESIEEAVVSSFFLRRRRARMIGLLRSKRGRAKALARLAHCHDLDSAYITSVDKESQTPEAVHRLLRERGAPDSCYLVSELPALDGRYMVLIEALQMVVGSGMGTVVSCMPGRLAYFESEDAGERYILERAY